MHERCPACGLVLEREQGYFVGAIYVNYAATVGITIVGFLLLDSYSELSFGFTNYQQAGKGFTVWIDDIALAKDRVGTRGLPPAKPAKK